MKLIFKQLGKEDCKNYLPLLFEVGKDLKWENWQKDNFLIDLPHKWQLSFICWINNEIIGYAFLSKKCVNEIYIHRFIIKDSYRKQGLGKQFIKYIESKADNKTERLALKVNKENINAQRFYMRQGFKMIDIHDNDFLMAKKLDLKILE